MIGFGFGQNNTSNQFHNVNFIFFYSQFETKIFNITGKNKICLIIHLCEFDVCKPNISHGFQLGSGMDHEVF